MAIPSYDFHVPAAPGLVPHEFRAVAWPEDRVAVNLHTNFGVL